MVILKVILILGLFALNGCVGVKLPNYPPLPADYLLDPCCHGQRIDGYECADKNAYIDCNGKCEHWANCYHLKRKQ